MSSKQFRPPDEMLHSVCSGLLVRIYMVKYNIMVSRVQTVNQKSKFIIKSSLITNQLSTKMAGLIFGRLFSHD